MLPVNGTPWGSKNRLEIGMISKQIRDFLNCNALTCEVEDQRNFACNQ